MNKKSLLLSLTFCVSIQPVYALPFDFLAGLTGQHNAVNYEKPRTVMTPIQLDIEKLKTAIKNSVDAGASKQAINTIFLQMDSLSKKPVESVVSWLQLVSQQVKPLSLSPQVRKQLECVIILSAAVYCYEKMQGSLFSIIKDINKNIMYWEKQQANPLSHSIHRPLSKWFSSRSTQANIESNLDYLRKMHEESCAKLGSFATQAEQFDIDQSIEKKYEWLTGVLKALYHDAKTPPHIAPTFESLENALIAACKLSKSYPDTVTRQITFAQMPSHFGRNWIRYLGFGIGATAGLSYYLANKQWAHQKADSVFDTFIKTPAMNFWNTIFNYDRKRDMPDASEHRDKVVDGVNKLLNVNHTLIDSLGKGVEQTTNSVKTSLSNFSPEQPYAELVTKYQAELPTNSQLIQTAVDKIRQNQPLAEQEERTLKRALHPLLTRDLQSTYKDKMEKMATTHNLSPQAIQAKSNALDTKFLKDQVSTAVDNISKASAAQYLTAWLPPANTKPEVVNIVDSIDLLISIGVRNTDAAIDVLKYDGLKGLDMMGQSFKTAGDSIGEAKTLINEGMTGMLAAGEKHAALATNMLDATRNVIAIAAILPTTVAAAFGTYKLWKFLKGMVYREPDYTSMRRALFDSAHVLNSYDYEHLNQMKPEHYGRLLYNVYELKLQAGLLPEPARHQFLLDTDRLIATNLTSEKKMNVINLMYRNYEFLNGKAA